MRARAEAFCDRLAVAVLVHDELLCGCCILVFSKKSFVRNQLSVLPRLRFDAVNDMSSCTFSPLTLLVGCQKEHPVCKN